jgi:hypothetical protein
VSAAVIPLAFDGGAPVAASLPALIDRASRRLIEARSSAEVLEAKHIAEAALHHAGRGRNPRRLFAHHHAGRDAHGRGNRPRPGEWHPRAAGDRQSIARSSGNASETLYRDLGIDGQRVSEWRMLRDAGPETVEEGTIRNFVRGGAVQVITPWPS